MKTNRTIRTAGMMAYRVLNLFIILVMTFSAPLSVVAQTVEEGTDPPTVSPEELEPITPEWTEPVPPDAPPGSTITIKGGNSDGAKYLLAEIVHVDVVGPNGLESFFDGINYCKANVVNDPLSEYLIWECDIVLADSPMAIGDYTYTATGLESGEVETGTFKDAFSVTPLHVNVMPLGTQQFTASGGFEPYTYEVSQNQSGGVINGTGLYTAGNLGLGTDIIDIIEVTDNKGNQSYAYAYIGDMGNGETVVEAGCAGDLYGDPTLNCTANDVLLASVTNFEILDDGCISPEDTVYFKADYMVELTTQERYDIGLYFATDGDPNSDGAYTGTCSISTLPYSPQPDYADLDGTTAGVQDTCGDIDDISSPIYHSIELTVPCNDEDGDGNLDLPYVITWSQGANWLCTSPLDAIAGTTSKCSSDAGFDVPIPVPGQIIVDKVTDPPGSEQSFEFNLTGSYESPVPAIPGTTIDETFYLTDAADAWKSGENGNPILYEGTYSIAETEPYGWSLVDPVICESDIGDTETYDNIELDPGETVKCTFTNELQTGNIIIYKETNPDGSLETFEFDPSWGDTNFTLTDGQNYNSGALMPGTYTVEELIKTGWILEDLVCTDPDGETTWDKLTRTATIDLDPLETVRCTFTNNQETDITVCKEDTEGDPIEGWKVYLEGDEQLTGTNGCYTWTVTEAGTYTASEEDREGWTATLPTTHDFNVVLGGGPYVHTFTNFQDVEIEVCKEDTEGDPIEGWKVYLGTDEQLTGTDGCYVWTVTEPGTYTASEETPEGWTPTYPITHDFVITSGMAKQSHTFVNFQDVEIEVCKEDTEGDPIEGWKVYLEGDEQLTGVDGCYVWTVTEPGTYTASEETPEGWTPTYPITHDFVITSGMVKQSHTFVNFQDVEIEVCKEDTEGDPIEGWKVYLGTDEQLTGTNGCYTWTVTEPGTYTASEEDREGWTATLPITHDFVITSGMTKQSHTFVNFQDVEIEVCKEDSYGIPIAGWKVYLGTDEQLTGTDGCYTWTVTEPGTYTASEEEREHWEPIGDTTHDFVITSGLVNQSHTFVNGRLPKLTLIKTVVGGTAPPDAFFLTIGGLAVTSGETYEKAVGVPYAIDETDLEFYVFGGISGEGCPSDLGDTITLAYGDDITCTITNYYIDIEIDKQISDDYDPITETGTWSDNLEALFVGTELYYRFIVENTGEYMLEDVKVTDSALGTILYGNPDHVFCTYATLAVDEVQVCGPFDPIEAEFDNNYEVCNTADVVGTARLGTLYEESVTDSDTACYTPQYWAFTPGFWKNHTSSSPSGHDAWQYTEYNPDDLLIGVGFDLGMDVGMAWPKGGTTPFNQLYLLDALRLKGGAGLTGAAEILLRAGVASLLNASFHEVMHPDKALVYFPYSSAEVIAEVNAAIATGNPAVLLDLAALLDGYNNGYEFFDWEWEVPEP